MELDYEGLLTEDYELFLPRPAFSKEKIELTLSEGEVYTDVIRIVNKGEGVFTAFVECLGNGLKVDSGKLEGNDVVLTYHIDTKVLMKMDNFKPALLLTFLGGEKVIPFHIHIQEVLLSGQETFQVKQEKVISPKTYQPPSVSIQLDKKAYDVDESATFRIINHDIYPIKVEVMGYDDALEVSQSFVSVTDKGSFTVSLKKTLFEKVFARRKSIREPEVVYSVVLKVTTEEGIETIEMPVVFTNYLVPVAYGRVKDDRAYREATIKIAKLYVKYLLKRQRHYLKDCIGLLEESMAYHPTDVELRMFYLIVMMDVGLKDIVHEQVDSLLRFLDFYEAQGRDEFIDIIEALSLYLNQEPVDMIIKSWPMTTYRQLFKYHLFDFKKKRFRDYEALYIAGVRNTFLYAETVYHLNAFPEIPAKESAFYRFILRWAINKGAMGKDWLKKLENSYFQVDKYHHLDSGLCFNMYALMPGSGMLKLLCMTLMDENNSSKQACSIYYEVLNQHIYIKDALLFYIRSAYQNRLSIDTDLVQLSTVESKLSHDERAYLYTQFIGKRLNEGTNVSMFTRYYNAFLETCIHSEPTYDERVLIGSSLLALFDTHQWDTMKTLLQAPVLSALILEHKTLVKNIVNQRAEGLDYDWLETQLGSILIYKLLSEHNQLSYLNYLINKERIDDLIGFYREGLLQTIGNDTLLKLALVMTEKAPHFSRQIGMALYEKGQSNKEVVALLMTDAPAPLAFMIALYHEGEKYNYYNQDFIETLMFKALTIRHYQEDVLRIYRRYRTLVNEGPVIGVMNRFFAAQVLIEEMTGTKGLIKLFEGDLHQNDDDLPLGLALLKMYQQLDNTNPVIAENILKRSIKNGIIFPWFSDLAMTFIKASQFRKVAFFSYHTKSYVDVTMYCLSDDETRYMPVKMKHVAFGMYIGYVIAFYQEHISYYIEEETIDGNKSITESGIYVHEQFVEPEDENNGFDTINTVVMSQMVGDDESIKTAMNHYIDLRKAIHETMVIL